MNKLDSIPLEVAAIRHRVANCLQVLAALARTPADESRCAKARWSLERVNEQVQSISRLHAMFDLETPHGLTDHLTDVAAIWSRIGQDRGIEVQAHLGRAPAGPGHLAAPLAMIANTALMNCFDHGFPAGRTGRVEIGLGGTVEGGQCLTVIDDGVGWEKDPTGRMGRGCKLISDLAGSIGGRVEWRRHAMAGSIVSVVVPPAPRTAPS